MIDIILRLRAALEHNLSRPTKARLLAETVREAGNYRWVGLYDVGPAEITAIAWTGSVSPAFPSFPVSQGLNGAAAASGKPVIVQDVSQDPRWLTTFGSTRAEAIFPVLGVGGTVVGTIDVESDRIGAFGPDDEALLDEAARVLRPFWTHPPTGGSA
jgi:GAF domain-containing protein